MINHIKKTEAQKALIKTGYSGIKEKIKTYTARISPNGKQRLAKRKWSIISRYVNNNPHN